VGSPRSLEACRGKVVVLDFWYRGCAWCIRAMPQVKQIAAHFQGRPVEVFGMNTDRGEADAKFVVDKLALNYPTLKGEGVPEKYGVSGFPTLLVIDQAGVLRDIHVGYSPTLAKNVIASVEKLLANPPAGGTAP
jgi:thiol-disulfide isomerase/thioredoxin